MKVTVIGGGSTYTPELINGFLARTETFPLTELWLMDIDQERLAVVGGFAQRMLAARGAPFRIVLTTDRRAAIQGAAYVLTQLRVGKMEARRADEYLGQRHGLIGQETTGVGGMAKALRTIPVLLQIAGEIGELAPQALLINFTNPAGLVTEALARHAPGVSAVGVCNVPIGIQMRFQALLEAQLGIRLNEQQTELNTLGLNHLTWHRGFTLDGEDIWPRVLKAYLAELHASPNPEWETALIETLQMIPNSYLQYYYHTNHKLAEQAHWPPSRAEAVAEIEATLLRQYAESQDTELPADLMKRGGAYYSTMATQLLNSHYNNLGETHVANVPHKGAVAGWPADWVLEMPCRVDANGIQPLPAEPLPPVCFGLVAQVKAFELLTVAAAVHGDRAAAYQALLVHPLGPETDKVEAVLADLLETHREHLPQFQVPSLQALR